MVSCIQGSSISNGPVLLHPTPSSILAVGIQHQLHKPDELGWSQKNRPSIAAADDKPEYRVCSNCSLYLHSRVFTVGLGCGLAARQDCGSRSRRIITNNTCSRGQLSQVGQGAAAIVRSWLPEPPNSPTVVDLPAPTGPARGRQRATFARTNSRSFGRPASGTRPCTRSTR
jgi:hypothetical protein